MYRYLYYKYTEITSWWFELENRTENECEKEEIQLDRYMIAIRDYIKNKPLIQMKLKLKLL